MTAQGRHNKGNKETHMATVPLLEETQEAAPRIKARGHLSLVDWNPEEAEQTPQATVPQSIAPKLTDPVRRTAADRLYGWGVLLLMAAAAFAAFASLTHL